MKRDLKNDSKEGGRDTWVVMALKERKGLGLGFRVRVRVRVRV
jgi:hypothetical protein